MAVQVAVEKGSRTNLSLDDRASEREEALAALDEIDARYDRERRAIEKGLEPQQVKCRLLARLSARRLAEREPLVRFLLQLRESERITANGQ
jgi:hypothetical protein